MDRKESQMEDDYMETINDALYEREYRLKYVLKSQLVQLFSPTAKSCPQDIIHAIEAIIRGIFNNTYLDGPEEESCPNMKVTKEYQKAYETIRGYMADIPYMPR